MRKCFKQNNKIYFIVPSDMLDMNDPLIDYQMQKKYLNEFSQFYSKGTPKNFSNIRWNQWKRNYIISLDLKSLEPCHSQLVK